MVIEIGKLIKIGSIVVVVALVVGTIITLGRMKTEEARELTAAVALEDVDEIELNREIKLKTNKNRLHYDLVVNWKALHFEITEAELIFVKMKSKDSIVYRILKDDTPLTANTRMVPDGTEVYSEAKSYSANKAFFLEPGSYIFEFGSDKDFDIVRKECTLCLEKSSLQTAREKEPNDRADRANKLEMNTYYYGTVDQAERDCFKFVLDETKDVAMLFNKYFEWADCRIYSDAALETPVAEYLNWNNYTGVATVNGLEPGTYYVVISDARQTPDSHYLLMIADETPVPQK